jgi:hypothetical protein
MQAHNSCKPKLLRAAQGLCLPHLHAKQRNATKHVATLIFMGTHLNSLLGLAHTEGLCCTLSLKTNSTNTHA